VLEWNALPGPVLADLEAEDAVAASHYVLRYRAAPTHEAAVPLGFLLVGALVLLGGGVVVWRDRQH
jgi:hypothetical protein